MFELVREGVVRVFFCIVAGKDGAHEGAIRVSPTSHSSFATRQTISIPDWCLLLMRRSIREGGRQ